VTDARVRFRPASLGDADGVSALINERERLDRGVPEVTAAAIRGQWTSSEIELAADALIGELDGRIVCGALATRDREFVDVATAHEGRGLGSRLLEWVMDRSVARRAVHHLQIIGSGNAAAAALLRGAGYERARSFLRMGLALEDAPAAEPGGSAEIRIRAIDVERDARELHRLDAAAFAGNADYQPETFEQFRDEHLLCADGDPEAMLAADDAGQLVGSLLAARRRGGEVGYVSVLAVDPAARRRGIASLLLRSAFGIWRARELSRSELTVASDNPGGETALRAARDGRRVYVGLLRTAAGAPGTAHAGRASGTWDAPRSRLNDDDHDTVERSAPSAGQAQAVS
jgi:ribosomal protein S18 acetylase RimI-like enzyme